MHFVCGFRFDDQFADALLLPVPNQCAVFFFNALQNVRRVWSPAAVWKDRVREGELGQRDLAASQKRRWIRSKRGMDARRGATDATLYRLPRPCRCARLRHFLI